MVGDLEHATFSNIEHQSISFAVHTIRPWVVRLEQAMNRALFSDKEKGIFMSGSTWTVSCGVITNPAWRATPWTAERMDERE